MGLSLFNILNMGAQSLSVEQQATGVAGQNLANVNNPNYAEQTLQTQTAPGLQTSYGEEGTGIQATGITQNWDSLLNNQIVSEGSTTGSLTAQQSALQQAEAYLNEQLSGSTSSSQSTSSSGGLTQDLSNYFGALQTLTTNPSSIPDRQAVIQAAQQLATQFNSVSSGLSTVTSNLNSSIASDVQSANQDMSSIAALNQQISYEQASGGSANDLIDQREQKIEDLSSKVNITTTAQADGSVNISIGGVTMVSGNTTPDWLNTAANGSGNLVVQDAVGGTALTLTGGSIEGSITARDGAIATLNTSLNTLATQIITQTNAIYRAGYDLNGNSGAALFTGSDASDMGVTSTLLTDPSSFQAAGAAGAAGDNTVAVAMANMQTVKYSSLNNETISQNYAQAVGAFGGAVQSATEQLATSTSVSQMLTSQRTSETGVDTDTEMTNLMQFQKAYEASAEMISTINQMLETVVNMKTS
jgi:flagellar hook-associated protein 1 FlgK